MLILTSIEEQLRNLGAIASIECSDSHKKFSTKNELLAGYRVFIEKHYKRNITPFDPSMQSNTRVITDIEEGEKISRIFVDTPASRIDDLDQTTAISYDAIKEEQEQKAHLVQQGLEFLKIVSWEHSLLTELVVTDLVILPSTVAYGGSTSDGLGIIWANPNMNWRVNDTAEFLVHELTHQCMFVDEICHGHYDYELLMKKENWAQSAILNKLRPVDKVLHSVAVAVELLHFREVIGHPASPRAHPPTTKLLRQTGAAIHSLKEIVQKTPELLKPRAKDLLETCATRSAQMENECELEA